MRVLIIEDEIAFRQVLESQMKKEGIDPLGVGSAGEAIEAVATRDFDVVVTDLRLPDRDGLEIIRELRQTGHEMPILLMTAFASVRTAVDALKAGAADYLIKPVRVPDLIRRVQQINQLDELKRENRALRQMVQHDAKGYWVPETAAGDQIKRMVTKVAGTDLTVLITGDSGTGKGMTARLLHSASRRSDKPFIPVNCGAIPEQLVESELFGHVKGAFTGADRNKEGLFLAAEGGTLFLDEVGELPLAVQVKLLHAIEEKMVRPVGASRARPVDVRIVAATNRDLEQMIKDGEFRMDLYYRLNIFQIQMPPLRQHGDAVVDAIEFVLNRYRQFHNMRDVRLTNEALDILRRYSWPGNLRELENVLERAVLLCDKGEITPRDLPPAVTNNRGTLAADAAASEPAAADPGMQAAEGAAGHSDGAYRTAESPAAPNAGGDPIDDMPGGTFRERIAAFERRLILEAIDAASGDRRAAARDLGVGLSTLYRKLEETSRTN